MGTSGPTLAVGPWGNVGVYTPSHRAPETPRWPHGILHNRENRVWLLATPRPDLTNVTRSENRPENTWVPQSVWAELLEQSTTDRVA